jgi:nucleotide-binding universal stress UspA family protein
VLHEAERQLAEAAAISRQYGVDVVTRIVRARHLGEAIVDEAGRRGAEIIVLGSQDRHRPGERMLGHAVDFVLRNAGCRVMVGATPAVT